jgi:hypothetical protein
MKHLAAAQTKLHKIRDGYWHKHSNKGHDSNENYEN